MHPKMMHKETDRKGGFQKTPKNTPKQRFLKRAPQRIFRLGKNVLKKSVTQDSKYMIIKKMTNAGTKRKCLKRPFFVIKKT